MSLIVDASVAVKWVTEEEGSAEARALYLAEECIAPTLIIAEVGNALWKKQRRGIVTAQHTQEALQRLPRHLRLIDLGELAMRAAQIAGDLDHPIYDCFYLALAERERAPIVSADAKLLAAAKKMKGVEGRKL
jgi:predicted nucleic acid-binding protein